MNQPTIPNEIVYPMPAPAPNIAQEGAKPPNNSPVGDTTQ